MKHSALMEAKRILAASQGDVAALEATAKVGANHNMPTLLWQKHTESLVILTTPSLYIVKTAFHSSHLLQVMFSMRSLHIPSVTQT